MQRGKKIVVKFILVAILFSAADFFIGGLLQHFYFKISHGEQGRVTYTIDSCNQDVLILGSSRAAHHYISAAMSENLHLGCYNAGKDKQGLWYNLAVLKMILLRYSPSFVILDLNPASLVKSENGLDVISVLLPYYQQHPEIRPILNQRSKWEFVKTYSALYRYNSLALQIAFNNFSAARDANAVAGYVPLYRQFNKSADSTKLLLQIAEFADNSLIEAFEQIIQAAESHGCKLIVVSSPVFFIIPQPCHTIEIAKKICLEKQIPFFDYSTSKKFTGQKPLFSDVFHLNHQGASLFTQMLCSDFNLSGVLKKP